MSARAGAPLLRASDNVFQGNRPDDDRLAGFFVSRGRSAVMNIGIIGLPQTGKRTLFDLLVGAGASSKAGDAHKLVRGVAEVNDPRFTRLADIYQPKKAALARINVLMPPSIEERAVSQGGIFRDLLEVDAFCHVVRAFEEEAVYHLWGNIDPARDIDYVNTEFLLHDLLFVEKRIDRLEKDLQKQKNEEWIREKALMLRFKEQLDAEHPLRLMQISPAEGRIIASYPLLTMRQMVVVLNVSEGDLTDRQRAEELAARYGEWNIRFVQIAVGMESEIGALESDEERRQFMQEMGIEETALPLLTREWITALGLVSFFTVAGGELRQWFVRRGATAVEAAGKIHTDMARGFIRAEVVKYDDLIELGSEDAVKHAGRSAVKGRDYVVEDGDVLTIRFNV